MFNDKSHVIFSLLFKDESGFIIKDIIRTIDFNQVFVIK